MANLPTTSAKNVTDDSATFVKFTRRLMSVPHAEIKEKLEAEKAAKRTSKSASHASGASSKRAT
jgi:hypothetical protein